MEIQGLFDAKDEASRRARAVRRERAIPSSKRPRSRRILVAHSYMNWPINPKNQADKTRCRACVTDRVNWSDLVMVFQTMNNGGLALKNPLNFDRRKL